LCISHDFVIVQQAVESGRQ